ncbi:hypothetical protein CP8484711_2027A, partial [Chlamydia psittaci 84-8471/1]
MTTTGLFSANCTANSSLETRCGTVSTTGFSIFSTFSCTFSTGGGANSTSFAGKGGHNTSAFFLSACFAVVK